MKAVRGEERTPNRYVARVHHPRRTLPRLRMTLRLPSRHPVADAGLSQDVGGVVRIIAQLAPYLAYHGAHGKEIAVAHRPQTRCSRCSQVSTRPALAATRPPIRNSMTFKCAGLPARSARPPTPPPGPYLPRTLGEPGKASGRRFPATGQRYMQSANQPQTYIKYRYSE